MTCANGSGWLPSWGAAAPVVDELPNCIAANAAAPPTQSRTTPTDRPLGAPAEGAPRNPVDRCDRNQQPPVWPDERGGGQHRPGKSVRTATSFGSPMHGPRGDWDEGDVERIRQQVQVPAGDVVIDDEEGGGEQARQPSAQLPAKVVERQC